MHLRPGHSGSLGLKTGSTTAGVRSSTAALALLGFATSVAQVVLLREVLAASSGNELSIGLSMGFWLGCAALGSILAGRLFARADVSLGIAAIATALIPALGLAATRWMPVALGLGVGEVASLEVQLVAQLLALGPAAALGGAQFALASRAVEPTRVYLAEALGWLAGGAASTWLLSAVPPFYALALVSLAAILAALLLSPRRWLAFAALIAPAGLASSAPVLERYTMAIRWPGQDLVQSAYTTDGHRALVASAGQLAWYEDGHLSFVLGDRQRAEELAHLALLHVKEPRRVLLAGAIADLLPRVLEHPVEEVVVVVPQSLPLDLIVDAAGDELRAALSDERVEVVRGDVRRLLGESNVARWDALVLDVPPPSTLLANRLYTRDFFERARAALREGGALAFPLPASDGYLDRALVERNGSIFKALAESFPVAVVAPMANHVALGLSREPSSAETLGARLRKRRIASDFVDGAYLEAFLEPARQSELASEYREASSINGDLHPTACMHDLMLWRRSERGGIGRVLEAVASRGPWTLGALLLVLLSASSFALAPRRHTRRTVLPLACIASIGFAAMSLGILLLFGVQIVAGSLHHLLGLMLATHMAGIAGGAVLGSRLRTKQWFAAMAALLVTGAAALLFGFADGLPLSVLLPAAALLNTGAGATVGAVFSASLTLGVKPSTAYGADLLGGGFAAIAVSALIVPAHGLIAAMAATGATIVLGLVASALGSAKQTSIMPAARTSDRRAESP